MKKLFLFSYFILTLSVITEQIICFQSKNIVSEYNFSENEAEKNPDILDDCADFLMVCSEPKEIIYFPHFNFKLAQTNIYLTGFSHQIWQPPKSFVC
jgi:hypothetical protein